MTSRDLQIGQSISAGVWFRCGKYGDDKDYACITGNIIRKIDCNNQILIDVDIEKSFNPPLKQMCINLENTEITINN